MEASMSGNSGNVNLWMSRQVAQISCVVFPSWDHSDWASAFPIRRRYFSPPIALTTPPLIEIDLSSPSLQIGHLSLPTASENEPSAASFAPPVVGSLNVRSTTLARLL